MTDMTPTPNPHNELIDELRDRAGSWDDETETYSLLTRAADVLAAHPQPTPATDADSEPDRENLIARASWWSGWCTDNDDALPELAELGDLLLDVKHKIALDRPATSQTPAPSPTPDYDTLVRLIVEQAQAVKAAGMAVEQIRRVPRDLDYARDWYAVVAADAILAALSPASTSGEGEQ